MTITALNAFRDNYIWTFADKPGERLICVDPGEAGPVFEYLKRTQQTLTDVLITHHHPDHTGGLARLMDAFPKLNLFGPNDARIPLINHPVSDKDLIEIGHYQFQIITTPGHTKTHICFFEPKEQWLFCGDTLFSSGCGRVFEGTHQQLYDSLMRLKNLPPATKVFCGHEYTQKNLEFAQTIEPKNKAISDYLTRIKSENTTCSLPSTIELEKKVNPFFRVNEPGLPWFAQQQDIPEHDTLDLFTRLRHLKDHF